MSSRHRRPPLSRVANLVGALQAAGAAPTSELDKAEIYSLRKRHFSKALSISYENTEPLLVVRGDRQYLYDEQGHEYLDTRNNVAHVGHANPRVAAAVSAQVAQVSLSKKGISRQLWAV